MIGFSVSKRRDQRDYTKGDVIAFEGMDHNPDNNFNEIKKIFTCPLKGIYFVAVTLMKFADRDLKVELWRDKKALLRFQEIEVSRRKTHTLAHHPGSL